MRSFNAVTIYQRRTDRYLDATAMCGANGKFWGTYWQNQTTREYADELSFVIGIPITELVQVRQGGTDQGTWVHPRIALHLAQWLSAKFAVMVSGWIEELLTTGSVALAPVGSAKWLLQQAQLMVKQEEELAQQQQQMKQVEAKVGRLEELQQLNDAKSGQGTGQGVHPRPESREQAREEAHEDLQVGRGQDGRREGREMGEGTHLPGGSVGPLLRCRLTARRNARNPTKGPIAHPSGSVAS